MDWRKSNRSDPRALPIADRHYNRQKPGSPQFVPPGRCLVLLTDEPNALWVTSWPFAEYVRHAWPGAWICSCFRNESETNKASSLIVQAVQATKAHFGEPPEFGMVTFIDPRKVKPTMVHGVPVWGWTYKKAGFHYAGLTKGGLIVWQMNPADMPEAMSAHEPFNDDKESQLLLWAEQE